MSLKVGETSLFKAHGRHDIVKADSSLTEVYGLDRTLAVENTFATEHGVVIPRSQRRLARSPKRQKDIIVSSKAVPWGLKGDGSVGPSFFFNVRGKTLPGRERAFGEERKGE